TGSLQNEDQTRPHLLDVTAAVSGGRLRLGITYSRALHAPATIANLGQWFIEELTALIDHCCGGGGGGFTPSDIPDARRSQEELDQLMNRLKTLDKVQADEDWDED